MTPVAKYIGVLTVRLDSVSRLGGPANAQMPAGGQRAHGLTANVGIDAQRDLAFLDPALRNSNAMRAIRRQTTWHLHCTDADRNIQ